MTSLRNPHNSQLLPTFFLLFLTFTRRKTMKANIGPLEISFSRLSKSELKRLMNSSSRSVDEESSSSSDDEHSSTGSQVTHKAGNLLTRQLFHPFTECGNLNESLPSTPRNVPSPKSNHMPALFMETELEVEDAPIIPYASYKPTPKVSNVSYDWNSPRNRSRSAHPDQAESPLFFGQTFFQHDGENDRTGLLASRDTKNSFSLYSSSSSSSSGNVEKKAKLMSTIQKLKARQKDRKRLPSLSLSFNTNHNSSHSSSKDDAQESLIQNKDGSSSFERQLAFDVDVLEPDDELAMKWQMIMEDSSSCWEREYQPYQKHSTPQMGEEEDVRNANDSDNTEPAYSTGLAELDFHQPCFDYTFQRARRLPTNLSTVDEMSLEQQSVSSTRTRSSSHSLRHILLDPKEI